MPVDPMNPRNLMNAATFEDASEIARKLLDPDISGDELADLMEHAVDKTERAHAVIFYLALYGRGIDPGSGVDVATVEPTYNVRDLMLP